MFVPGLRDAAHLGLKARTNPLALSENSAAGPVGVSVDGPMELHASGGAMQQTLIKCSMLQTQSTDDAAAHNRGRFGQDNSGRSLPSRFQL